MKSINILILDDQLQYVTWMEDFIKSINSSINITFTDRFDRAVKCAVRQKPDIIITDICIGIVNLYPEINKEWGGLKFIHHVRNVKNWKKEECEIITYTGEVSHELIKQVESMSAIYGSKNWMDAFKDDLKQLIIKKSKSNS